MFFVSYLRERTQNRVRIAAGWHPGDATQQRLPNAGRRQPEDNKYARKTVIGHVFRELLAPAAQE